MRRALLGLGVLFAIFAAWSPASGEHFLPSTCAIYPTSTTYEGPIDRSPYLVASELASFNMIAPNDDFFGTSRVEEGPRSNRRVAEDPFIPASLLKAIAHIESNTAQADHTVYWGATGPTKVSFDCGHGIMQITSGMTSPADDGWPSTEQALVSTHYMYNVARGAAILATKWNTAPQSRPVVGNGNPRIVEDWYYAIWSYNGFAGVNNPLNYSWPRVGYSCGSAGDGYGHNRGNYPYQELAYGCMARPPFVNGDRLWTPQAASLPNLGDPAVRDALGHFPNSSQMDMPSPVPTHQDNTSQPAAAVRDFLLGSPSLRVSPTVVQGDVSAVTITNTGSSILAWRARPEQDWLSVDQQAGVALSSDVPCTSGEPCSRSPTLTITIDTDEAPPTGEGQVTIESLTTGQRSTVRVILGRRDHFYLTDDSKPAGAMAGRYAWEGVAAYISPGPRSGWVPLYRLWKGGTTGDHFYASSVAQRDAAVRSGYTYEKVAGYVSPVSRPGLVPLYRLWKRGNVKNHFYTTSVEERNRARDVLGYTYEGVTGYVSAVPAAGLAPFYRWWNRSIADHFYTMSSAEPAPAPGDPYRFEGVEAYVSPAPRSGWTPLYRLFKGGSTWDHFYTTSSAERNSAQQSGYRYEGVVGYIATGAGGGRSPLYRLWKGGATRDHFYTTSAASRDAAVSRYGYEYEGVTGYVPTDGAANLVPLFRWWAP